MIETLMLLPHVSMLWQACSSNHQNTTRHARVGLITKHTHCRHCRRLIIRVDGQHLVQLLCRRSNDVTLSTH